jgi:hypothetical protein
VLFESHTEFTQKFVKHNHLLQLTSVRCPNEPVDRSRLLLKVWPISLKKPQCGAPRFPTGRRGPGSSAERCR